MWAVGSSQWTDSLAFLLGLCGSRCRGAHPVLGPSPPGGSKGPERAQTGGPRAPGRRRLVIFFLDESLGCSRCHGESQDCANPSALGLSRPARWKAKASTVTSGRPALSLGLTDVALLGLWVLSLFGAEIQGHVTSGSEGAHCGHRRRGQSGDSAGPELAPRRFLGGTSLGRFFIRTLHRQPAGQMTAASQA